jgi:hypothetical protein
VKPVVGRRSVAAALLVAGLLAGCGSTSSQSSGTAASNSASAATGAATGQHVVRVFGFGIETQPALGALFTPATYVVTEPQLAANAINGSSKSKVKLTYTFCDTKGSPSGSVACAKQAASPTACDGQPCDVAMETADIMDNLSVPLLAKEGLPIVSATTGATEAATVPQDFGLTVSETGLQSGLAYVMKQMGAHKVGIMSVERPDVQIYDAAMAEALKAQGLSVAGHTDLPLSAPSPNAAIGTVMSGGADGLIDAAVGNVGAALKYAKQTYPGVKIAMPVFMVSKSFFNGLPDSVVSGIGTTSWIQPVTATNVPGIKDFLAEGGLAAATAPYRGSDFATMMWLATRFIGNVASTISGPITRASMLHALSTAQNVNMYGILPPWNAADRGKHGAAPNTPYNVVVAGTLRDAQATIVADNPGVFIDATTGKVAYVDAGAKAP